VTGGCGGVHDVLFLLVGEVLGSIAACGADVSLDLRTLNVRGRRAVLGSSGYRHSRSTRLQFLHSGKPSSHLTRRLRHVRLFKLVRYICHLGVECAEATVTRYDWTQVVLVSRRPKGDKNSPSS
jgi:hypothetical protein